MSIQAMTWALSLPIPPSAKLTLVAIANYADERGWCFPSIRTIAVDSSQSESSVQRRFKELEAIGAPTRLARSEENGRRTSDQVRLNLALRREDVARADDEIDSDDADESGDISAGEGVRLTPGRVSDCDREGVTGDTGTVSLVTPAYEPSIEPDSPQSPPLPALGASTGSEIAEQSATAPATGPAEPEGFTDFLAVHPGAAFSDRGKTAQVFSAMTPAERISARAAARDYAADCARYKRKPKNADRWLRERGWEAYPNARLPEPAPHREFVDDPAIIAAMRVRYRLDRPSMGGELALTRHEDGRYGLWMRRKPEQDVLALAHFVDLPVSEWSVVREGLPEFHAWRERFHQWFGKWPDTERVWIEPHDPDAHDVRFTHPNWRLRKSVQGMRVPCAWPPLKDGTLSTAPPSLVEDVDAAMAQELSREFEGRELSGASP